jgi:small multidrug resistance pump
MYDVADVEVRPEVPKGPVTAPVVVPPKFELVLLGGDPVIHYLFLLFAIVAELIGTLSLKWSNGFTRPLPVVFVLLGYSCSFIMLALALKHLPVGPVYAIWAGLGAMAVTFAAHFLFGETLTATKLVCIALILAGVMGLHLTGNAH